MLYVVERIFHVCKNRARSAAHESTKAVLAAVIRRGDGGALAATLSELHGRRFETEQKWKVLVAETADILGYEVDAVTI